LLKVFAKPPNEQEDEIFFYSMMFLVLAGGAGITMFLTVCISFLADCCVVCQSSLAVLMLIIL